MQAGNGNVLQRIERQIGSLTKAQKKVADYVLKHPMNVAFSTVEQLGRAVGTSTTTIVRLTTALGWSGYADFQRSLQEYMTHKTNPADKLTIHYDDLKFNDGVAARVVHQQMENINQTIQGISDLQVNQAIRILSSAGRIFLVGYRSSFSVAHYLYYNLNRIYGKCYLIPNDGSEAEWLTHLSASDAVVAISMPRYIKTVALICKLARERGVKLVSITDSRLSPLADNADVLFCAECKSLDFHNAMCASMLIAEILINAATKRDPDQVRAHLVEAEQILQLMDVHANK